MFFDLKIESIVERDFFPDLERLRLRKEYQEAVDAGDLTRVGEIQEKWGQLIASEEAGQPQEGTTRLDDFLERHTSEDNASFLEIVKETRAENRKKFWWLYEPHFSALPSSQKG